MNCRLYGRILIVLALVVPLFLGATAMAQEQAQAQTQAEKDKAAQAEKEGLVRVIEEVTVTGSLIPRKDLEALSPVAVVNVEEVTYQGTGRVEDLIQQLPQAFAAQNSTISNGASGTATVQLRNLGSVRTLGLLNGRRMASGDAYWTAADLNFIPAALVSRVDVLTGGASSAYGADAVAGVVNFVIDTEFEGVRGEVMWNGYQHNNDNELAQEINARRGYTAPSGNAWDQGGYNFNVAVGGKFGDGGKGHAMAFVDYRDVAAITKDARDYTNCSVQNLGATGPACGGSATWEYGRFLTNFGDYVLDPRTGNTNTFRRRVSTDVFNFAPYNFMQRNDEKWSGGAFARYRVNEKFEPYTEVMVMHDYSDAQIAPSGSFFTVTQINCDNPMMSAQQRAAICGTQTSGYADMFLGRRNVEGGGRNDKLQHTNWRLLAGVRGDLSPTWNYDVYAMHAQVDAPDVYENDFLATRLSNATDVIGTPGVPSTWQCRSGSGDGCVPYNVFTIGGVTQEAINYLQVPYMYNSGTKTQMLAALLRGDMGGAKLPSATEPIEVAFGGEIRKESLFVAPDFVRANGLGAGSGGPTNPVDGNYQANEAYAELRVPLVQDASGFNDLSLELGYRFANYKASEQEAKNNSSYKAMLSWAPVDGFRLRGGINRAVRAPNVQELFAPQGLGLGGTEDICAGPNPSATREQCVRTGVPANVYGTVLENPAGQYNSLNGGNPQLDVETADTYTVGLVWTPKSITGLTFTADYFDITIEQTISSFQPDDTIKACAETGDALLCGLIRRDARYTLWLTNQGYTISTNQNIGTVKSRGMDLSLSYPWNLGDSGFINFAMMGSTVLENRTTTPLFDYDCAGYMGNQCGIPSPAWRHRLRASWNTNFKFTFSANWRFISGVENDDLSDDSDLGNPSLVSRLELNGSDKFPAYNWFDLAIAYKFSDKLRLTLGCNNILDKEPPLGSGLSDIDYGPGYYGTYDPLGRSLFANLQFEF
jgi:outer membrane receptor protein involved in Fe transport